MGNGLRDNWLYGFWVENVDKFCTGRLGLVGMLGIMGQLMNNGNNYIFSFIVFPLIVLNFEKMFQK